MVKEFRWYGLTWEQLAKMPLDEFAKQLTSRERRTLQRGLRDREKKLLAAVSAGKNNVRTHCRDMIITPAFVGKIIKVHSGKEFVIVTVDKDMLGRRLGEFAQTRRRLQHSAPGIGATRSSASLSVK
jgi:small subunit ribosomal protein S19